MENHNKRNYIIVGVVVTLVLLSWLVLELTTGDDPKKASTTDSIFKVEKDELNKTDSQDTEPTIASTTSTTRPSKSSEATKAKLNELPLTAFIDMNYPENYLSYRYETIMAGEFGGDDISDTYLYDQIAITELDDPINSDLPASTFTQLRSLAIATARAQATGENTSAFPSYFTPATYVDKCTSFSPVAAGAISMPYPNDDSWALGVVYWKATCTLGASGSAPVVLNSHQNIFMHRGTNGYVPVPVSSLPRA